MGLVIPWSCTLAMIDVYSVFVGCPLRVPGVMVIVVVGDCVRISLQSSSASRRANSKPKKSSSANLAGPVDSLVRRRLLERRGDRPPPPAPWIPQLPDVLREVPAVCHDGVLVLAPHGRLCHLQPLVRRLTVVKLQQATFCFRR